MNPSLAIPFRLHYYNLAFLGKLRPKQRFNLTQLKHQKEEICYVQRHFDWRGTKAPTRYYTIKLSGVP